jgi:hypothetical protein
MVGRNLGDQRIDDGDDVHAGIGIQVDHFQGGLGGIGHQVLDIVLLEDQVHEQLIARRWEARVNGPRSGRTGRCHRRRQP